MTTDARAHTDKVDALVIFGATGDLAKLETFPALVGLVDRGVLDFPVIGVAKSGWGLEQFRAYAENSFDLVLMDLQMPEMDGFAATSAIRRTETDSATRTPIVAITAHALEGDRERCLAAGMDDYISKPIDLRALARLINGVAPFSGERNS